MIDLEKEWSISFAGCGFMSIYYVGVSSCILERFPRFIHDAAKIYGASAGSLMAAVLTLGIPLGEFLGPLEFSTGPFPDFSGAWFCLNQDRTFWSEVN